MSIIFSKGNFWDYEVDARINTVNCVGVMGKGIALQFRRKFPKMFDEYKMIVLRPGALHYYRSDDGLLIINFPTKIHWRNNSKLEYIEKGLSTLRAFIEIHPGISITIPPLGCGNGNLNWSDVRPMIEEHLGDLDAKIYVFEAL